MTIDLRSDTLTKPSAGMLAAMAAADVGDDVYREDPTVNRLESRVAQLFGHEAGLFCVTGSMSNLLGIWAHTRSGGEVLCDAWAHIARAEMGAHAALHGVTMRTWVSPTGLPSPDELRRLIAPDLGPYLVATRCVEFENTHNFAGGTVADFDHLAVLTEVTSELGIATHLDGARIWNAHVATGIPLADYGRLFDTVSVCFSKGLGAPVGSMLLGSKEVIDAAWVQRKRLGGGWRQAGVLAAAAEYALDHHLERLANDHVAAQGLAATIAQHAPQAIDLASVHTNIVVIQAGAAAAKVVDAAREAGVLVSQLGATTIRAVTHLGVTADECRSAGEVLGAALA